MVSLTRRARYFKAQSPTAEAKPYSRRRLLLERRVGQVLGLSAALEGGFSPEAHSKFGDLQGSRSLGFGVWRLLLQRFRLLEGPQRLPLDQ